MDLIHKDVQVAGAWSSRRGVFAVLALLGVVTLAVLIGACGTSAGAGNAPSQTAITSSGASGSTGAGNAPSQTAITSSGTSIGGDDVQPPSAATSSFSPQGHGLSTPPTVATSTPASNPTCPTPESPGSSCPTPTPTTPTPTPTPTPTTLAPASGLAGVFSLSGLVGRLI